MIHSLIITAFFVWYLLALIVSEQLGKRSAIGTEWLFFISMIASPLVGYLIARFTMNRG